MGVGGDNLVLLISLIRVRDILHNQVTLFIRWEWNIEMEERERI